MSKRISRLLLAGALALAAPVAMAQTTNVGPGGGAKMNNAPSADAFSDKSSPAMKTPGMAAPMQKGKKHVRMHHRSKKMSHTSKAM